MLNQILIYSPQTSPRLQYTFAFVFNDLLGIEFSVTKNKEEFKTHVGAKLNYSENQFSDELIVYPVRFLFEKGINDQQLSVFDYEETKAFFGTHPRYSMPFDMFAAIFFLVSRYEEYLPHIKDEHERFIPSQSLAKQKEFLHQPVVNIWAEKLKKMIAAQFPDLVFRKNKFTHISTIDVDSVYAYREKGLIRNTGAIIRSAVNADVAGIKKRLQVIAGIEDDPFDTFDFILQLKKKYALEMIFFFLVGDYDVNDKNISLTNAGFQQLIKSVADYAHVGIHPSYASNKNYEKLSKEIHGLENVLKRDVHQSRQHFLKMTFPYTYRNLIELDITEDYTMGYASEIGFRAGTCTPFYFYDLDLERETKLKIFPFALMDGTLKDALKLSTDEAIKKSKALADEVKKVNGTFITLWHNHSFDESSEWMGWKKVYEEIAAYCATKND